MNINTIKEYVKDHEVKGYHLIFKLINGSDISFSTNVEEFNKIKEWYDSDNGTSYPVKNTCSEVRKDKSVEVSGKYINLNKLNIVEFSYSSITNQKSISNPIMYILTYPTTRTSNVIGYFKGLFLSSVILIAYLAYRSYILNIAAGSVLSNKTLLDAILNKTLNMSINFVTIVFLLYYLIFFVQRLLEIGKQEKDYVYQVINQKRNKIYNYASFNFFLIVFFSYGLRSVNFF